MADFQTAQQLVKVNEGGYSNDSRDGGNWTGGKTGVGTLIGTNYGISAPTLSAYLGRTATVDDMKNLSYPTALTIYKNNYWNPIGGDNISNQSIANIIYDMSVNEGIGKASKIVGDSLGIKASIPFTSTVSAINSSDPEKLFNTIKQKRADDYNAQGGYALSSWLNRLSSISYSGVQAVKAHPAITIGITFVVIFSGYFFLFGGKNNG